MADIPVAMMPNLGKISLLQMDGEISKEDLFKALELAKKACKKIYDVQKNALKNKYGVENDV